MCNSKKELINQILENDEDLEKCNIDEEVIHELISGKVSKDINESEDENITFGERAADKIASFGGSWKFILIFCGILFGWIILNSLILRSKAFDAYPFVFLNLVLSCLAAVQAPVIMMSQNRQTEKDRLTAENDYLVNLKSEIIIEDLHNKLDILIEEQQKNKEVQGELLKEIEKLKKDR